MDKIVAELKKAIEDKKIRYNDLKVRIWIIKYKEHKELLYLRKIQHAVYPIILGVLKNFLIKNKRKYEKIDVDDLIGEAFIVLDDSIKKFRFNSRNLFITYYWKMLLYSFQNLVENRGLLVSGYTVKKEHILSIDIEDEDDENKQNKIKNHKNLQTHYETEKLLVRQIKAYMLTKLTDTEYDIFLLRMKGWTKPNIMNKLKVSELRVDATICKIKYLYKTKLEMKYE